MPVWPQGVSFGSMIPRGIAVGLVAAVLASGAAIFLFSIDPFGFRKGVVITVENTVSPAAALCSAEVSVSGDAAHLGEIAPGAHRTVRLHPSGDSDVTVRFALEGNEIAASGEYVEDCCGYRIELVVRERGVVFERPCLGRGLAVACDGPLSPLRK